MPKLLQVFLLCILFGGLTFVDDVHLSTAQSGTNVTGIISLDTTWTKANSPYNFTGPVAVNVGVTLTVEHGTTVNLNGYYLQVNGTLIARGTSTDSITIGGGSYSYPTFAITFGQSSPAWNDENGKGSIIEYAILNSTPVLCMGASPKINHNTISGEVGFVQGSPIISNNTISGLISDTSKFASPMILNNVIYGYIMSGGGGPAVIANNTIIGNAGSDWVGRAAYQSWGIIIAGSAKISDNNITGEFEDSAVSVASGAPTIVRNVITNNLGYGCAALRVTGTASSGTIRNNTITTTVQNALPIVSASSLITLQFNNIQGYSQTVSLSSGATGNINATYNWWGSTDVQTINQSIHDFKNDFNLGTVNFVPFLTEPNPHAPVITTPALTPTPTSTQSPNPSPATTSTPAQTSTTSQTPTKTISPSPSSSSTQPPTRSPEAKTNPPLPTELIIAAVAIVILAVGIGAFLLGRRTMRCSTRQPFYFQYVKMCV